MDIDTDTNTQLTEAEVAAAAIAQGFVTGAHTVDTDTQLTEAEVAAAAIVQGFVTGAHTVDTDTQLTDAEVAAAAIAQGFVSGAHTVNTDTQLTEAQVDAYVANNGYLAPDASGNVGLGTTTPAKTLEVKAGSSGNGINLIAHNSTTAVIQLESGSAGGYMQLHDNSNDQKVRLDSTSTSWINGGNVGIGTTSPGEKLTVTGTIESTSGGMKFPDGTTQSTAASGLSKSSVYQVWVSASNPGSTTASCTDGNDVILNGGCTANHYSANFEGFEMVNVSSSSSAGIRCHWAYNINYQMHGLRAQAVCLSIP